MQSEIFKIQRREILCRFPDDMSKNDYKLYVADALMKDIDKEEELAKTENRGINTMEFIIRAALKIRLELYLLKKKISEEHNGAAADIGEMTSDLKKTLAAEKIKQS